MSLVALAMRMSAVEALKGATLSGPRIYDSAVLPIDKAIDERGAQPFTAIATEDEVGKPAGRDLNNGDRLIDLVIESMVASILPLPGEDGEAIVVAETDATLELSLAILSRQIDAALWGRGGGAWGEVFRSFCKSIEEVTSRRGMPTENGQRFAARQVAYRVRAFAEPAFGTEPPAGTPMAKFLAALADDPRLSPIASVIREAIMGNPSDWPAHYTAAAVAGGLTESEAEKIGLAPLGGYPSDQLSSVTVEPAGWELDVASAEAHLPEGGE